MSSVRSRKPSDGSVCPVRVFYGLTEQRRSRNMAVLGLFGLMTLTLVAGLFLQVERVLTLPAVPAPKVTFLHAQFRTIPEKKVQKAETKKILTEESPFEVAEEPELKKVPEPEAVKKPEVRPEPAPKPAPADRAKAKPVKKSKPAPVKKPVAAKPAEAKSQASDQAKVDSVSGGAAPAAVGAAGSERAEKEKRSAALSVILQTMEKHKRYPRQGRRSGAEGTCRLLVHVGPDGKVDACTLAEGSGKAVLDAAAKRLGEKLIGVNTGTSGGFNVLVPVHYSLTDR